MQPRVHMPRPAWLLAVTIVGPAFLVSAGGLAPTAVGCAACNAADGLQDFVLTAAGELQLLHATPSTSGVLLCANASCAGDPSKTACFPMRLAPCSSLTTKAESWFNHSAAGGLLTATDHAVDFGTWAPGAAPEVGLGRWSPTMSWERWKVNATTKRISTVTGAGAVCCLSGGSAPPPAPPAPPPATEQPCRGQLTEIVSARLRLGVCVGDAHNNATCKYTSNHSWTNQRRLGSIKRRDVV
jgi:hypothetical protein